MTTPKIGGLVNRVLVDDEYKKGWYDGYQAAQRDLTNTQHYIPPINPAVCKGCGMDLRKMTHYVCNLSSCPSKVSC